MFENDLSLNSLRNDSRFREIMEIEWKKWVIYRSKFRASSAEPIKSAPG